MAGDWIKVRSDLYRDPKVCVIADLLMAQDSELSNVTRYVTMCDMSVTRNIMRNAVVGALTSVWGVFRHKGERKDENLLVPSISIAVIDDIAELPGFGDAMEQVGWVSQGDEGIVFPRYYATYNVDPDESKRSKAAERQRRYREKNSSKHGDKDTVTSDVTGDVTGDVTVTHREEKRRVENIGGEPPNPLEDFLIQKTGCDISTARVELQKAQAHRGNKPVTKEYLRDKWIPHLDISKPAKSSCASPRSADTRSDEEKAVSAALWRLEDTLKVDAQLPPQVIDRVQSDLARIPKPLPAELAELLEKHPEIKS
ncbi:MAG: hypothetical protein AAF571_10475 [Verrucomicrobiota bacterium]